MVDTPSPKPEAAAPFKRGQIQWSRPPQTVFRVDLPQRTPPSAPRPTPTQAVSQALRPTVGAGILRGSMVPTAAPKPTVASVPSLPTPEAELVPVETPIPTAPRPTPVASAPEFVPVDVPIAAVEAVMPVVTQPLRRKAGVPVTAWVVGAAVAVLLAAGLGFLMLKPDAPASSPEAIGGLVPETTDPLAPVDAVPVPEVAPEVEEAEPEPTPSAEEAPDPAPSRPAPTTVAPSPTPRLNTESTAPRIEAVPLTVAPLAPPPTAAEAPTRNPDAPIQTRPQPLD